MNYVSKMDFDIRTYSILLNNNNKIILRASVITVFHI